MTENVRARIDLPVVRRMTYFWLAIIIAMLVIGCAKASSDHPTLWLSWRGPAMVALSLAFVGWFQLLTSLRPRYGWPPPRRVAYPFLAAGFVMVVLLLSYDQSFLGLVYALMGLSAGILPTKETLLPVGAAILLYAWSLGLVPPSAHGRSWFDVLESFFSIGLSVGIIYLLVALVKQRFQLERLVQELHAAHRRLRLSAARDVDLAALRERNRLAREMHDSLGHALVSLAIKLEAVQRLYAVDVERATAEMEETKALVRSTMADLRSSLAGLRPAALEEQPLSGALAEMTREMGRRTGVEATCTVDEQAELLDRAVQETLYRVGQEALTNVAKHAHAQRVAVNLAVQDGAVVLEVSDNGVGLDAGQRNGAGHYGILGMRERVEALGGRLTLGPRPGGGTVLRAKVPAGEAM